MFKAFIEWIKSLIGKLGIDDNKLPEVAVSAAMQRALEEWVEEYERPKLPSLELASGICGEVATAVTLEFKSEITGSERADFLNEQYKSVLDELRTNTEYACAKGGLVFKPYPEDGRIQVQAIQADMFFPTAYDSNRRITGAYFVEQINREGKVFTRFELHDYTAELYTIRNYAFVSKGKYSKGTMISLAAVPEWSDLLPEAKIEGADRPLFAYFRMPMANKIDPSCPLGVSVFAKGLENIKEADKQFASYLWEYEGAERAVSADESLFYANNGDLRLPKGKERLYRPVSLVGSEKLSERMDTYSPTIRDESYARGLNELKQIIEFNCGLAYGTISDPQHVDKTATEIKTSKQRSYQTVSSIQKSLQGALDDLIYAMDYWTTIAELAPAGKYSVSYVWDDSILVDAETTRQIMLSEVAQGIRSPESYLIEYYGMTEEEARGVMPTMANII